LRGRLDEWLPVEGFRLQVASRDPASLHTEPSRAENTASQTPGAQAWKSFGHFGRCGNPVRQALHHGHRVDVATVIGALGAGESYESVEQNYSLTREQILTALPLRGSRGCSSAAGGQGGVRFLLDENFPLALYRRLRDAGKEVEHVIALGQRGVGDDVLRKRLAAETLVFLTHDEEFGDIPADFRSQVIISDLPQRLPIRERVEIWFAALEKSPSAGRRKDCSRSCRPGNWSPGRSSM